MAHIISIQAALIICNLFICDFAYDQSRNCHFPGTYTQIYSYPWSFYIRAYFLTPYLSHITRSTCNLVSKYMTPSTTTNWIINILFSVTTRYLSRFLLVSIFGRSKVVLHYNNFFMKICKKMESFFIKLVILDFFWLVVLRSTKSHSGEIYRIW